jgi:hypothetical protein
MTTKSGILKEFIVFIVCFVIVVFWPSARFRTPTLAIRAICVAGAPRHTA